MGHGKKGRKLLLLALIGAGYAAFKAKNKNLSPAAAWEAPTPRPADPSPPTEKEPVVTEAPAEAPAATDVTPEESVPEAVEAVEEPAEAPVEAPAEPPADDAVVADVTGDVTGDPLTDPLADPLADPAPAAEDDGSFFEQVMAETTDKAKPSPKRRTRRTAKDKPAE